MAETQLGIRKWLNDNGFKDDEITYDNNAVKLRNKYFTSATPQADGSTYDTNANLQRALQQYQTAGRASQVDSLLNTATQKVNQPAFQFKAPGEFKFDAQSDPQYQAALRQAQQNAQTAGNNAMVALGSRGIGNSSITGDRVAQIQQKELGRVSDTILPQLLQQAYQRYADGANRDLDIQKANYGVSQDQLRNILGVADTNNGLVQQQADNDYRDSVQADKQKQDRIALANYLGERYGVNVTPTYDTSLSYDQVAGLKPMDVQKFEEDKARYGEEMAFKRLAEANNMTIQQAQLAISRQNAGTSAASQSLAQERFNWDKDPNNLDNQYKQAQIEAVKTPKEKEPDKSDVEASYIQGLESLTPDKRKEVFVNEKAQIIKDLGMSGFNTLYNMYFDQYGDPK